MLQAYVDDSHSNGAYVLGGFISSVERWLEFSKEWEKTLSAFSPPMKRFKMSEVMQRQNGAETAQLFYRIVERVAVASISVSFNEQDYREALKVIRWPVICPH